MLACPSLKIMQSRIAQQGELVLPLPESLIGLLQTLIALLVLPFKEEAAWEQVSEWPVICVCSVCLFSLVWLAQRQGCVKCSMVWMKGGFIRLLLNHWLVARSSHHPQKLSGGSQRWHEIWSEQRMCLSRSKRMMEDSWHSCLFDSFVWDKHQVTRYFPTQTWPYLVVCALVLQPLTMKRIIQCVCLQEPVESSSSANC